MDEWMELEEAEDGATQQEVVGQDEVCVTLYPPFPPPPPPPPSSPSLASSMDNHFPYSGASALSRLLMGCLGDCCC
uniref:Uncharacterized protein n=1 Tax=Onchocerca volvulus TaxID=6282 RepID=A0A8R1TTC6_ONCVO